MSTLREIVYNSVIELHRRTGKEWIPLKEIYKEVDRVRDVGINNGGASVRAALETHSTLSSAFSGTEEYILKEKGSGLYKSVHYEKLKYINNIHIGDIFTRQQLMQLFKISGQSGIMKTTTLNCIVLTTSEFNGIYVDSSIENNIIIYTGEGKEGNQELNKNNKILFDTRDTNIPIYLFTKERDKKYVFEGRVQLFDEPYQVEEKDKNHNNRLVWKFPLQIIHSEDNYLDNYDKIDNIIHEIKEIENNIEIIENSNELVFKEGPLNLRKYRKTENHVKRNSKPDFIAQEIIKSKQGLINEKCIYDEEIKRLTKEGALEQVKEMKEFFKNKKENEGYDILTFECDNGGKYIKKYIEVKSTKGNEGTPIDITADEIEFAKEHIDDYYLYRIINSDSDQRYVKIVKGKDLLNNYKFVPTTFKIYSN